MTRTPKVLISGLALSIALTGCAQAAPEAGPATGTTTAADFETVALQAAGFEEGLDEPDPAPPAAVAAPASSASSASAAEKPLRPRVVRKLLRKNTLHGEVVVQGREGERTIVVQRGEVTAADGSGFTVTSSDGFEQAWTFGDPLRVAQNRKKTERSAVKTGVQVAVGGARDGATTAARLIVIR